MSTNKEPLTLIGLSGQNKQLSDDLRFANKCLNILTKFKTFVDLVFTDYKNHFNANDVQKYDELKEEVEELLSQNERIPVDNEKMGQSLAFEIFEGNNVVADQSSAGSSNATEQTTDPKVNIVVVSDMSSIDTAVKLFVNDPQHSKTTKTVKTGGPDVKPRITERQKNRICFYCSEGFMNAAVLMAHIKEEHTKSVPKRRQLSGYVRQSERHRQKFGCTVNVCNKSFSSREYLALHIKTVHRSQVSNFLKDNPKLKCDSEGCNFTTFEESVLNNHKNRHSSSESWICSYDSCGKKLLTEALLYNHIQAVHHNIRKYKCEVDGCHYTTNKSNILRCHKNVVHRGIRPFHCPQCYSAFGIEELLKRHIRLCHPLEPKPFKCEYSECEKEFKTKAGLNSHINLVHLKIEPKEVFGCDQCDFKSSFKSSLTTHKNTVHRTERLFDCDYEGCTKSFKTLPDLNYHQKRTHSFEKKYKCNECKVSYKYQKSLKEHNIREHTDSSHIIPCDYPGCQYKTKVESFLKRHKEIHKTAEDYPCDWPDCNKWFKSKAYLERHSRIHTNTKPYACEWPGCEYRSTQCGNLKKHLKVHVYDRQLLSYYYLDYQCHSENSWLKNLCDIISQEYYDS